jgi:hypothetical protein
VFSYFLGVPWCTECCCIWWELRPVRLCFIRLRFLQRWPTTIRKYLRVGSCIRLWIGEYLWVTNPIWVGRILLSRGGPIRRAQGLTFVTTLGITYWEGHRDFVAMEVKDFLWSRISYILNIIMGFIYFAFLIMSLPNFCFILISFDF